VIINVKSWATKTTIGKCAAILSQRDRRNLAFSILLQVFMAFMDLLAVGVIGVIGALAVSGVQSANPSSAISQVLEFLHIDEYSLQTQTALLGIFAACLLITKTIFSIFFSRKILFFLSRRGAEISSSLFSKLMARNLDEIQEKTSQESLYAITTGVSAVTLGILGAFVVLLSDVAVMIVLGIGLTFVNPILSLGTIVFFGLIGILLHKYMSQQSQQLGLESSVLAVKSNELILQALHSYRELVVRNRRAYYAKQVSSVRKQISDTVAQMSFLPSISKYVIETVVVLSALLAGAVQFLLQDAENAVATLSIFLAAGTRIAPAVLRIQQGTIGIKGAIGGAAPTLALIEKLGTSKYEPKNLERVDFIHNDFKSTLEVRKLSYKYLNGEHLVLNNIDLKLSEGQSLAIVGPSGAGKTTLVDLMLGVLQPKTGYVHISELEPVASIQSFPGAIGYVPQDIQVIDGTIRENIAFGFSIEEATDARVWQALEFASLVDFVESLPQGIDASVGERGTKISGGQRQRLGIARAIFTNPKFLVLDEATSTLDSETERLISQSLDKLKGTTTLVMIAHRLATIINADKVLYLESGEVKAFGTLTEVREAVPNFDSQVRAMGIN
jgi:ABC-type multidrug transport system fused ATPase/permease subunit